MAGKEACMRVLVGIVTLVMTLGALTPAHADVLCVKKTKKGLAGAVTARSSCRKTEQQIDAALGQQLGIRGNRGPGLAVVNDGGTEIGIPVGTYYGSATVATQLTAAGARAPAGFTLSVNSTG